MKKKMKRMMKADLMVMKDNIRIHVLSWHSVCPKFLHEKDLIGKLGYGSVPSRSSLSDPVGQVANKVKEKVTLWHTDHFVSNLDEEAEAFSRSQIQPLCNIETEVFGACTRVHLECLISVVGKVHFMEDLRGFVLNGFHFNQMWRVLSLPISRHVRRRKGRTFRRGQVGKGESERKINVSDGAYF